MQYIKKVILDRNASPLNRVPDQSIVASATGTNAQHIVATRDQNGKYLLVYTPTGAKFTVDTSKLLASKQVYSKWFDPVGGTYQNFTWTGQGNVSFTPPKASTHADWILVLEV
jgi:hypothetical protein